MVQLPAGLRRSTPRLPLALAARLSAGYGGPAGAVDAGRGGLRCPSEPSGPQTARIGVEVLVRHLTRGWRSWQPRCGTAAGRNASFWGAQVRPAHTDGTTNPRDDSMEPDISGEGQRGTKEVASLLASSSAAASPHSPGSSQAQRLMEEFEEARRNLTSIPEGLHALPTMDPNGVYANHNLRLDEIKTFGFDYDYTLAHYTRNLQPLIYDLAKEHLVKELRYPEFCLHFKYDHEFPIRGLFYDKKRGYLLKLDFFHSIEPGACYFGRRRVDLEELQKVYGGNRISVEHMSNLVPLMDLFCLSEACLISDVVHHFVEKRLDFDPAYVYEDVKRCIDYVHRTQAMHQRILHEPSKYLVRNVSSCRLLHVGCPSVNNQEAVVEMLQSLKQRGKRLFILTNSPYPFVDGGMRYLFQNDGMYGESWHHLFDVVMALADKPNFYTSERPFRYYNTMKDNLTFRRVDQFKHHGVYYHGCLRDLLRITKWRGPEVLYFGDHLYSDLRGPARAGWRTAAIIRELEHEISTQNETEYRFQQMKYHILQEILGRYHALAPSDVKGDKDQKLLSGLQAARGDARLAMRKMFNPYFGSTFLTDSARESAFSYNVQRYADVYTSRLENFMRHSSEAWLYTPYDVKVLPHHIKIGPNNVLNGLLQGQTFSSTSTGPAQGPA
eukprot:SM000244S08542  [mRNA]  locus=s244:48260:52937:+ [translate_table: standard]